MREGRPTDQPAGSPIRPALSRALHDRDGLRRRDFQAALGGDPDARVLLVSEDYLIPVIETEAGVAVQFGNVDTVDADPADWAYLGTHDGLRYAMVRGRRDIRADHWLGLREIGAEVGDLDAGLVVQAVALAQWHDRSKHCPMCGAVTELRDSGWVRRCAVDGTEIFPRTDPAMIVLVHDGADRCVLGRQSVWPTDRFSVLAGFVEPGESAEQAVAREVFEEVRLTVSDIRYVTSQPWPLPQSLMLGFNAQVDGHQALVVDLEEIAEAAWFTRTELLDPDRLRPKLPPPVSIAHQLISNWLGESPATAAWP